MISENSKNKAHLLVQQAKEKGLVKKYEEFCETDIAKKTKLLKKEMNLKRYCNVYESLEESLKEVKLIKEGKIKPKKWDELYEELKKNYIILE